MKIKKILLIRPNSNNDKKENYVTFPLGLGYIAAVLQKADYNIHIIDLTIEDVDYNHLSARIKNINPNLIGISALGYEYLQVKNLSKYLKKIVSCPIILGGHLASHNYSLVLEKLPIDVCVLGEGEITVVDLVNNIDSLPQVDGIAYKENGKILVTRHRKLISDLDTIPFPAYELFDINKYSKMLMDDIYMPKKFLPNGKIHKKMSMEIGRGCPFNCHFCSKMFTTIRRRSIEKIVKEIKFLKNNYDINIFGFQDELLFVNFNFIKNFCEAIEALDISWHGNARIDTVSKDMINILVKSRCLVVSYGVESGSASILKNMNKKTQPEQIKRILKMTLKAGMPIDMGLILGYPGEDENTVQETVDLLKEVGYPGLKFRYITPYPGSKLYNDCREQGIIVNEEEYLESLGDGSGPYRFRINFTNFTDDELTAIVPRTTKKVFKNYIIYLLTHPKDLIRYIFRKDVMNPVYYLYKKWTNPTNYDKAAYTKKK